MTPAPQSVKIEHDGQLYLRWSRSSTDEAIEYLCDVKKGTFISASHTSPTSAEQVLSITEKDLTLIYDSLLLQEEGISQIMALEAVERTRQRGREP